MPHSLFLGSALATQDRLGGTSRVALSETDSYESTEQTVLARPSRMRSIVTSVVSFARRQFRVSRVEKSLHEYTTHAERENNSFKFIRSHLYHGIIDMVLSLLGLAVVINSL